MKDKKQEKKVIRISPKKLALVILFVWGASLGATWFITKNTFSNQSSNEFPLLNPRLETFGLDTPEERNAKLFATLYPLKEELLSSVGDKKENVAFYVEDLNTGGWIGWQERDPFIAASLLKVPVAIGAMKKVERGEWSLDESSFSIEEGFKDDNFGELWKTPNGTPVTVRKLLEEMLQNSDNTAVGTLVSKLTPEEREDIYYHIGVTNAEKVVREVSEGQKASELSSKDLATVFRALFNATYLTRKSSNYILELLTETKFDEVMPKTVPDEIKVAHKIGNFLNKDPNRPQQYHDCGIVYYPQHPYLYCVMTKNYKAEDSESIITGISGQIYKYFDKGNGKNQ